MDGDPPSFDYDPATPYSTKVKCSVCGRRGYGQPRRAEELSPAWSRSWFEACRRGHSPCPDCGRPLSLKLDGAPRIHARCPARGTG